MKFSKEEAVEKLNALLTNSGKKPLRMSKKTLESQTETLMAFVTDDEMELDTFVEKVKSSLENINSNIEKEQSDFVKAYQKEHPAPKEDPKPKDEEKSELTLLRERVKALEEMEQQRTRESLLKTKRSDIEKYLSENNVKDSAWVEKTLGMIALGENDDVEERGKALVELYNLSHSGGPSITPKTPRPGEGDIDSFDDVKSLMKQRIAE